MSSVITAGVNFYHLTNVKDNQKYSTVDNGDDCSYQPTTHSSCRAQFMTNLGDMPLSSKATYWPSALYVISTLMVLVVNGRAIRLELFSN